MGPQGITHIELLAFYGKLHVLRHIFLNRKDTFTCPDADCLGRSWSTERRQGSGAGVGSQDSLLAIVRHREFGSVYATSKDRYFFHDAAG